MREVLKPTELQPYSPSINNKRKKKWKKKISICIKNKDKKKNKKLKIKHSNICNTYEVFSHQNQNLSQKQRSLQKYLHRLEQE